MHKVDLTNKTILITGAAGFIGANLVSELLRTVYPTKLVGLDSCNDYYDISLKEYRLVEIEKLSAEHPDSKWIFIKGNIADKVFIERIFSEYKPDIVVNLAAQAGVRYSITNPDVYIESNLIGFYNIWKLAEIIRLSILSMHLLPLCMAQIKRFRTVRRIRWTPLFHFMR